MNRVDLLQQAVSDAQAHLDALEEELAKAKKEDWRYSSDHLDFYCTTDPNDSMQICSNYHDWYATREQFKENFDIGVFNIETLSEGMSMSIRDAKVLVSYLQEKINFLEENDK